MPELPEVETIVRALRRPLVGQTFTGARNRWPRQVVTPDPAELDRCIRGQRVEEIGRRGKYLVFSLSGGDTLIIHLKMSGQLAVVPADAPDDPHAHTVFSLADGRELRFRDPRKFGRVYLVPDPAIVLGPLGPEPLSEGFNAAWLRERLQQRRRVLKPLLLDQTFLAGIGNIYADEALYRAGLRPTRHAHTLTAAECEALYAAIRETLETGIEREGASITASYRKPDGSAGQMQEAFVAYGQAGQICRRCGGTIERIVLGGRSTYYCAGCQR